MLSPNESASNQLESIRELSRLGRHSDALAAAETIAFKDPQNRHILYLVAVNQRCLNRPLEALATLERLEQQHPSFSLLFQERGNCYMTVGNALRAIDAFSQAVTLNPALIEGWTMLERLYRATGNTEAAVATRQQVTMLQQLSPEIVHAGSLFSDGELETAEGILSAYLSDGGNHAEAFRLLARIKQQFRNFDDAERLFEATLKIAPNYRAARLDYVRTLLDTQKYLQAYEVVGPLLELDASNRDRDLLSLYALACVGLGRYQSAIEVYRQLISNFPGAADLQVALGHALRGVGQPKHAISCYHAAARIKPSFGDAYWSLANLKTYRFSEDEVAKMLVQEASSATRTVDRYHLCFALGRAYENQNRYAASWHFYERGNALKRSEIRYVPEIIETNTRKQIEVCTDAFFARRSGWGAANQDPIFVVGLPRSGSTLIEQILASHSRVDGTHELPEVPRVVRGLSEPRSDPYKWRYPEVLAYCESHEFRALGERYIGDTRAYRGNKPFFIDKMPNNFQHIGLIHLMLPQAKIIEVRREPMACCFSNLKQLFASGQEFSYSMEDIARYYRTYIDLMRHWNAVLPGRLLKVCYEDLVEDLEQNVRRILQFCHLPFEPACLDFYKTDRSVATASSEQVRRPIFREGLFQWRNYEPWLSPLKYHLDDAVVRYRE